MLTRLDPLRSRPLSQGQEMAAAHVIKPGGWTIIIIITLTVLCPPLVRYSKEDTFKQRSVLIAGCSIEYIGKALSVICLILMLWSKDGVKKKTTEKDKGDEVRWCNENGGRGRLCALCPVALASIPQQPCDPSVMLLNAALASKRASTRASWKRVWGDVGQAGRSREGGRWRWSSEVVEKRER